MQLSVRMAVAFGLTQIPYAPLAADCTQCDHFWLSTSDQTSAVGSTANIPHFVGQTDQEIFVWARPAAKEPINPTSVSAASELNVIENFSLNLKSTNPGAIQFRGVEVFNEQITPLGHYRFEYKADSSTPDSEGRVVPENDYIKDFEGLTIFGELNDLYVGIGDSSVLSLNPNYDNANISWLVARIEYDVIGSGDTAPFGETQLFLEIGSVGINHTDDFAIDTDVVFGSLGDDELNARENRGTDWPTSSQQTADAVLSISPLYGDYNVDGAVNASDYTVWRDHLGQSFALPNEDPLDSSPGFVDSDDYQFWKSQFGAPFGGGSSSTPYSVPEPSGLTISLLALGVVAPIRAGQHR